MDKYQETILKKLRNHDFKRHLEDMDINNALVFGSVLTSDFNEASDVDIALLANNKLNLSDILNLELYLEDILNRPIDVIDLNSDTLDIFIKINILNTGKSIYTSDNNNGLEDFIEKTDWYFKENENFFYYRRRDLLS